jgi:iron(III) transport system substrate-binding protein
MNVFWLLALSLSLTHWFLPSMAPAASGDPGIIKAKKDAEARGYIFISSHEEIVARAKEERKLRVLSSFDAETYRPMINAFKKKYPFVDIYGEEITGTDAGQRFLLELKAGRARDWDAISLTTEFHNDYPPYLRNFDLLGMSEHGVLSIPKAMVDPDNRNIVALTSSVSIVAYNKSLIPVEKVPDSWEGFLRPEFKGRKFVADIRPHPYRSMVPLMGLDWVVDYCRKLAAQQPIWVRGQTKALTSLAQGEYAIYTAVNYHSTLGVMKKDRTGNLQVKFIEPVPVRLSATEAILKNSLHPHAGLLWLEFQASPEGQRVIDEFEPQKSSVYSPGSAVEKLIRGKKLAVLDWKDFAESGEMVKKIVEAFGFPKAER